MAIRSLLSRRPLQLLLHKPLILQTLRSLTNPTEVHRKTQQLVEESPLSILINNNGFQSPSHLHQFLQRNPFLLQLPSSDLNRSIALLQSFGFLQFSLISACPRILDLGFLRKWLQGFSELDLCNASSTSKVIAILQQSVRLRIDPEEFLNKLRLMRSAGFSASTVVKVFDEVPAAFMRDGIEFLRRIEFLKNTLRIVDSEEEINRICNSYPEFLAFPVDGRLRPLFSEFSDLGFGRIEIRELLNQNPRLLLGLEPGELSCCVKLIQGLKCRTRIKEKILSCGLLGAAINVKLRIDLLWGHGLIRRDAFKILHVEPRCILYSLTDIEKKIQFLLQKLGFTVEHLVDFPDYLGLNLEKQVVPRLEVIEVLKRKGAIDMDVELKHFVRLTRRKFYNFFVKPYPECEKIFGGLVRDVGRVCDEKKVMKKVCDEKKLMKKVCDEKKVMNKVCDEKKLMKKVCDEKKVMKKFPPGFWKLFNPPKYPTSEEDLKNMRHFMETLV